MAKKKPYTVTPVKEMVETVRDFIKSNSLGRVKPNEIKEQKIGEIVSNDTNIDKWSIDIIAYISVTWAGAFKNPPKLTIKTKGDNFAVIDYPVSILKLDKNIAQIKENLERFVSDRIGLIVEQEIMGKWVPPTFYEGKLIPTDENGRWIDPKTGKRLFDDDGNRIDENGNIIDADTPLPY